MQENINIPECELQFTISLDNGKILTVRKVHNDLKEMMHEAKYFVVLGETNGEIIFYGSNKQQIKCIIACVNTLNKKCDIIYPNKYKLNEWNEEQ